MQIAGVGAGGGSRPLPKHISLNDPHAAALLEQAQGHPLTPQQKVALALGRGDITPVQARQHLVDAGVLPKLQKVPGGLAWLGDLLGITQTKNFVEHPGFGTGIEAAAALPLPWSKLLKGAEIADRLGAPAALRVIGGHAARGAAMAGNAAAITNLAQHPSKDSALATLGLMLPTPPEEKRALVNLAKGARDAAAVNTAVNSGTLGAGLNAYGASEIRDASTAERVAPYLQTADRLEALNEALRPNEQGQIPLAALLARVLGANFPGLSHG